jgi:hypothetical protein
MTLLKQSQYLFPDGKGGTNPTEFRRLEFFWKRFKTEVPTD